ncbi:DUF6407 family protein [Halalkalibacter sp. AB-rgal2]|uniref:DUF6407 family protein n=1 Tax=Halalkalibacter sp. AB-rgal2 TaxID=3242695 RepID=UPI00359D34FA
MGLNIADFVNRTLGEINKKDCRNLECIKNLIQKAIDFYNLKSYEEVETNHLGTIRCLHIHSIVEENILSKIVEVAINREKDLNIEAVYEGHVVREY